MPPMYVVRSLPGGNGFFCWKEVGFLNRSLLLKLTTDLILTLLLLCQMSYMLIGETAHEWMGTAMFMLFILHQALNGKWYLNLMKGRYTGLRVLQTAVNLLSFLAMIGMMVSGAAMSRVVFSFLPIDTGMGTARILHMLSAYWGFVFMSVHLGLHWGTVIAVVRRIAKQDRPSALHRWSLRALALMLCAMGIYAFLKNDLASYLFLRNQFVFFDTQQPLALFFLEYISMMGFWACLSHYTLKFLQKRSARKAAKGSAEGERQAG